MKKIFSCLLLQAVPYCFSAHQMVVHKYPKYHFNYIIHLHKEIILAKLCPQIQAFQSLVYCNTLSLSVRPVVFYVIYKFWLEFLVLLNYFFGLLWNLFVCVFHLLLLKFDCGYEVLTNIANLFSFEHHSFFLW